MNKENKQSGYTLVEMMVAIFFLSVALMGYLRFFVTCSSISENTGNLTLALAEAQDLIEEIRNSNYDDIVTDYDDTSNPVSALNEGLSQITVNQIGAEEASALLEVIVTVSWENKNGRSVNTILSSYVAKN